jgi:hypothetical protein
VEQSLGSISVANISKIDVDVSQEESKIESPKKTLQVSIASIKKESERENPFANICQRIIQNEDDFVDYIGIESGEGFFYQMPLDLSRKLTNFEKIVLVKCLKPEKVLFGVQKYLELDLG